MSAPCGSVPLEPTPSGPVPESQDGGQRQVHDLGGALGYGPVPHDPDEPPFHHGWEKRVFGLLSPSLAISGNRPGEFRHALERLAPSDYFQHGYYGRWLAALELLLCEYGVLEPGEVDQRLEAPAGTGPVSRAQPVSDVDADLLPPDTPATTPATTPPKETTPNTAGGATKSARSTRAPSTTQRKLARAPRFKVGDVVVALPRSGTESHSSTVSHSGTGHTRLPGYAEAKRGVVAELHGAEVLPDSTAHDLGERPQHVYAVAFAASELWGEDTEPGITVHVDMYECYLAPANPVLVSPNSSLSS